MARGEVEWVGTMGEAARAREEREGEEDDSGTSAMWS